MLFSVQSPGQMAIDRFVERVGELLVSIRSDITGIFFLGTWPSFQAMCSGPKLTQLWDVGKGLI